MSASAPVPSAAVLDTMIRVIMSQTEMTEEEIKTELERTNYDLKRVIREYMRGDTVDSKVATDTKSTNQMRFSEIRNFMDKSSDDYYRRQEMTKIYNQVLEKRKAAAAATEAAAAEAAEASETTSKL
jgi:predicted transcriptional regulator